MSNDQAKQVLQQGIAAARAGQQAQARQLLQEAVRRDPSSEAAWLWLSSVAKDNQERIFCLKQLLGINPKNENALKGLKQLGVSTTEAAQPASAVPLADERRVAASISQLDPLLVRYQPLPTESLPFTWTKKTRGRVGDASAAALRTGVILIALVVLAAIVGGSFLLLRAAGGTQVAFIAGTPTLTPTITRTPTPTLGFTTTPSITPRVPQPPTVTPNFAPGSIYNRQPTAIYPVLSQFNKAVKDAQVLAANGQADIALPTLEFERKSVENDKKANFDYYYGLVYSIAMIHLSQGNPDKAQTLLNDNKEPTSAFYNAALAHVEFNQKNYTDALKDAVSAFNADPKLVSAALIAAKADEQSNNYGDARTILNKALGTQPDNTLLLLERGQTQLGSGNLSAALDDAQLAVYLDPLNRSAYILRNQALTALAANQTDGTPRIQAYGNAVLAAQEFLHYFPGDTLAWYLLGQAREGEGNFNAALDAYMQAVAVDQKSTDALQVFLAQGRLQLTLHLYKDALESANKALVISETVDTRRLHLDAARGMPDYPTVLDDLNSLINNLHSDDKTLIVLQTDVLTRAWIDKKINRDQFQSPTLGVTLTDDFIKSSASAWGKQGTATVQLYRGVSRYEKGDYKGALDDLNSSLLGLDSGIGHYYRGLTDEALNHVSDAANDYQWLTYWDSLENYPFAQDVSDRLQKTLNNVPTGTVPPSETPSRTPSITPTDRPTALPTRTSIPTRTPITSSTPRPTRTPVGS